MRTRRTVSSQLIGILLFALGATYGNAVESEGAADRLRLEVVLDEETYLVEQPVLAMVCISNVGLHPIEDLSPTDIAAKFLRLSLERTDGGPKPWHLQMEGVQAIPRARGFTLRPGESLCEVADLLDSFGNWAGKDHPVAASVGSFVLPVGRYRLTAEYDPNLHYPQETVRRTRVGGTVDFEVVPASRSRADEQLLREFAGEGPFDGRPAVFSGSTRRVEAYAQPWLGRFLKSRYFILAYYAGGWLGKTDSVDSLVEALHAANAPAVRQAALLWFQCKLDRRPSTEKLAWMGNLRSRRRGPAQEQAVATWELRVRQGEHSLPPRR